MSAEDDDTFDIDIYGENEQQQQADYEEEIEGIQDGGEYGYDGNYEGEAEHNDSAAPSQNAASTLPKDEEAAVHHTGDISEAQVTAPQQGTKRKAPDDGFQEENQEHPTASSTMGPLSQSTDPTATAAIKFASMEWWVTEEDLRAFCARAGAETELRELTFGEHKINGKSRGEAYLEFSSSTAAAATKREVDKANEAASNAAPGKRTVLSVGYAPIGNPFKTGANSGGAKFNAQNNAGAARGGAYNRDYGNQRGNFGNRGGFNHNRGGFNNHNNNNFNRMNQQQGGWMGGGMNGNMGGFANNGFMGNPMMGMAGNFNNMGRGGMMNNMMGRGGFGMGNMGGPMMSRGNMMGGNMMGRGGWNNGGFQGGMQQGFPNSGGYGGMQQQDNKRAKMG